MLIPWKIYISNIFIKILYICFWDSQIWEANEVTGMQTEKLKFHRLIDILIYYYYLWLTKIWPSQVFLKYLGSKYLFSRKNILLGAVFALPVATVFLATADALLDPSPCRSPIPSGHYKLHQAVRHHTFFQGLRQYTWALQVWKLLCDLCRKMPIFPSITVIHVGLKVAQSFSENALLDFTYGSLVS